MCPADLCPGEDWVCDRLYLQQPSALLTGTQSPLQLRQLLLLNSCARLSVAEGVGEFVNLLSQLALTLLGPSQRCGQPLLADSQRCAPIFALPQFPPGVCEPLLQGAGLCAHLCCLQLGPLELALEGEVGQLQMVRSAFCCLRRLFEPLLFCIRTRFRTTQDLQLVLWGKFGRTGLVQRYRLFHVKNTVIFI